MSGYAALLKEVTRQVLCQLSPTALTADMNDCKHCPYNVCLPSTFAAISVKTVMQFVEQCDLQLHGN